MSRGRGQRERETETQADSLQSTEFNIGLDLTTQVLLKCVPNGRNGIRNAKR